jgi:hypothetical protein
MLFIYHSSSRREPGCTRPGCDIGTMDPGSRGFEETAAASGSFAPAKGFRRDDD